MSQDIRLDVSYAEKFVTEPEAEGMKPAILAAQKTLLEKLKLDPCAFIINKFNKWFIFIWYDW